MSDELRYEYGEIPAKNRKAVEALHAEVVIIKRNIAACKKALEGVQNEIAHLLTDIRPRDLVKHNADTKTLRKSEVDAVYLIVEIALGFSGVQFYGRKMRKDGTPSDRVTQLYTGLHGKLTKVGRYRRGRTLVCTTSKG